MLLHCCSLNTHKEPETQAVQEIFLPHCFFILFKGGFPVINHLTNYYEHYDEDARLLSRPGQTEFLTTMRYISRYLSPACRVLEIGAGTGRYSRHIASLGCLVDAVELIPHNIDVFKAHMDKAHPVSVHQGNALDLHMFQDKLFDVTLLLGPLYHLMTQQEQLQALREAVRVTRPGGVIMAAYCMADSAILQHGFIRGHIHTLIENKLLDPRTFRASSRPEDIIALHRVEDIEFLRAQLPVQMLHLVATDGYAHHMRERLEEMDADTFDLFLQYHFSSCERRELLGYSNHALDIFRRL